MNDKRFGGKEEGKARLGARGKNSFTKDCTGWNIQAAGKRENLRPCFWAQGEKKGRGSGEKVGGKQAIEPRKIGDWPSKTIGCRVLVEKTEKT